MDFFEQLEIRASKFQKYIEQEKDTTMIILNDHLFVEELLTELLALSLNDNNPMDIKISQNMSFTQKMNMTWALSDKSIKLNIWSSIKRLNGIRNKMAHSLEPKGIGSLIDGFIDGVKLDLNSAVGLTSEDLDLRGSIGWLCSSLGYRLNMYHVNKEI